MPPSALFKTSTVEQPPRNYASRNFNPEPGLFAFFHPMLPLESSQWVGKLAGLDLFGLRAFAFVHAQGILLSGLEYF